MQHNKMNIQDHFLNQCRKEKTPITMFLTNGVQLKGKLVHYDTFSLILSSEGKQAFTYKHAISTIMPQKPITLPNAEKMHNDNKQDIFLSQCRKERMPLKLFLKNGKQLDGTISHFDTFSVILNSLNGKQQFIYKHAISSIFPERTVSLEPAKPQAKGE